MVVVRAPRHFVHFIDDHDISLGCIGGIPRLRMILVYLRIEQMNFAKRSRVRDITDKNKAIALRNLVRSEISLH